MHFYAGTSGYSYKEWKGLFYPKDLPTKDMLRFYAENLNSVEINNTFYRMPNAGVLESWREQVPPDFRFILKAPRKITHIKPLKDKAAETDYWLKTSAVMGNKLGGTLFQLPPYLRKDIPLLRSFLEILPSDMRAAFEFRHVSWFDDDLYETLREKQFSICCTDGENEELRRLVGTSDWGYFRLRKQNYSEKELMEWIEKINSQKWKEVYVFFKHEDDGAIPILARHFLNLAAK